MNASGSDLPQISYKNLRALVVDDYPSMQSAFKMALASFGLTKVDLAASASEAIVRVKGGRYDAIISDYNLGESRSGQQLLEELRQENLIGLETAFIMVTAESVYQRVVAAAELAPDDYLIKPFNGEVLRTRMDAVLHKKQVFRDVYRAFARSDLNAALEGCDQIIRERPKFLMDAMRFKGEVLVTLGDVSGAEALYRRIIEMRAVPWSRLGLAKTLHLQRQNDKAEELLRETLRKHPDLVAGYDLLADVQETLEKRQEAQQTLQRAVEVSANAPGRQRRLGEVALRNQDLATAEKAFKAVLDKGRNSVLLDPADCANLSRTYLAMGNAQAASQVISDHRQFLLESREGKLVSSVIQGQVMMAGGKRKEAQVAIQQALALHAEGAACSPELVLDIVEVCVRHDLDKEAAKLLEDLARNTHDDKVLLDKAVGIYKQAGKQDMVTSILHKATSRVTALTRDATLQLRKGDLDNAVIRMLEACREAPRNPRVLMNGVGMILRYLEDKGMHRDYLRQARTLLDDAGNLAPGHPRLPPLESKLRGLEHASSPY